MKKEVKMFILKKLWCRTFQTAFRIALPILPYREPKIIPSTAELGSVLKSEGAKTVLIVTDPGIVKLGLTAPITEALEKADIKYALYDKTQPNPTVDNVEEALKLYTGHSCEAIIAIGGGSAMDCAKALGARIAYPKKTVGKMGGVMKVLRRIPTLIAIPTTAGTGSETTLAAVITDSETHHKYALMSFTLIPRYAVLDAALTYTLPPHLTSTTGMDALTHAVEAFIGRSTTKETRRLAKEATKLVFENIEAAYSNGGDHAARENMLLAAYKAGIAFSKSYVGYVHAIAHSLGGKYGTPHGLANAVILPYVLEEYGKSAQKKLHRLAITIGISTEEDSHEIGANKFIEAIKRLNEKMNIPTKISAIVPEDVPALAAHAEHEANPLYPVPKLMTIPELEKIYYRIADIKK